VGESSSLPHGVVQRTRGHPFTGKEKGLDLVKGSVITVISATLIGEGRWGGGLLRAGVRLKLG